MTVPISRALGRLRLESFSSEPMEVAQIQPSKAKDRDTTPPNRPARGATEGSTTLAKL